MSVALKRNKGRLEWSATGAPGVGMGIVPQSITADCNVWVAAFYKKLCISETNCSAGTIFMSVCTELSASVSCSDQWIL